MINTLPQSLIEAATNVLQPAESTNPTHIDVDGTQKHRYNSENELIHPTDDGVRDFHKWFGDSKIVDSNGRPKVVYHGTDTKFDTFENSKIGQHGATPAKHGHWFVDDPEYARNHGGIVMKAYLRAPTTETIERDKLQHQPITSKDALVLRGEDTHIGRFKVRTPEIYAVQNPDNIKVIK